MGKSTLGRWLADALSWPFCDLDRRIEERVGRSLAEQFADDGEAAFRQREAAAVEELARVGTNAVIATGGGTTTEENIVAMQRVGRVVWLRASPDEVMADFDSVARPLFSSVPARLHRPLWRGLLAERTPGYSRADFVLDRRGRSVDAVGHEILEWLTSRATWVELGEARYPVLFDPHDGAALRFAHELALRRPLAQVAIVTDERIAALHLARYRTALEERGFRVTVALVPEGEWAKRWAEVERLAESLCTSLDREGIVVALGGGAVCDLAGLVASLLFRGVAWVAVPTTLLAQIDAAIGGKTGVNLPSGKNLLGTFHQPLWVHCDAAMLRTLAPHDRISGLGELLKGILLVGGAPWERLVAEAEQLREGEGLAPLIERAVQAKVRIVAADERERDPTGGRRLLNLGHTLGHAFERTAPELRHGEAVALGLLAAARVGERLGSPTGFEDRLRAVVGRLGLPVELDRQLRPEVWDYVASDKKRRDGAIRFIALRGPGEVRMVSLTLGELAKNLALPEGPRYHSQERCL